MVAAPTCKLCPEYLSGSLHTVDSTLRNSATSHALVSGSPEIMGLLSFLGVLTVRVGLPLGSSHPLFVVDGCPLLWMGLFSMPLGVTWLAVAVGCYPLLYSPLIDLPRGWMIEMYLYTLRLTIGSQKSMWCRPPIALLYLGICTWLPLCLYPMK